MSLTLEESAIVAAAQASEAVSELLRFAREGNYTEASPFNDEVVAKLAEALKLAIGIDDTPHKSCWLDANELALFANLRAAAVAFLEGWAG
ncbi:hypothetical protein KRZ98_06375 [Sphingobium sp. AS12]|uniref:hypothetical protein n=1 Tax=Sphingobium sp. AS12 TaxID=2849495 RepID=UPI001C31EA0B|nr:hypothetical protein [Sphingobium sp. AS12]MBV2147916.1 hypothetical protein [Sphingobium sp. AS12]